MKQKITHKLVAGIVVNSILLTLAANAASVTWDNGGVGDNWGTAENWNPDGVPVAADSPRFNGGDTITVNSVLPNAGQTYNGLGVVGNATLNVQTGASLSIDNGYFVGWGGGTNGIHNQTGGTFATTGGNEFAIGRGASATSAGRGSVNISGGTIAANNTIALGSKFNNNSVGSLAISGTGIVTTTSITMGNVGSVGSLAISGNGSFTASGNGNFGTGATVNNATLSLTGSNFVSSFGSLDLRAFTISNFNLDTLGIGTVAVAGNLSVGGNNTALNVDGSSYTGGSGTFNLFTFASRTGNAAFVTETLTGFAPGTASIVHNATNIQLQIIPEPSVSLLGALGIGVALLRRRR